MQFDPREMALVAWGRPDSPRRQLCGRCFGPLPETPLMLWRDDCSAVALCQACEDKIVK